MKLMRFLSFGSRSLTKGAKPMGRYQLPSGRVLPDFSSPKNPFGKEISPAVEDPTSPAGATARAASTQAAPPSPAIPSLTAQPRSQGEVARVTSLAGGLLRKAVSGLCLAATVAYGFLKQLPPRLGALLQRVKLRAFRRRSPFARTGSARLEGPVQGELSLDQVRVVRNDLTETDYEVVRAETQTASPVKRAPETMNVPAPARSLGRLAGRLFKQKVH
jgi:hypothetical protein